VVVCRDRKKKRKKRETPFTVGDEREYQENET
jgi:hypothetical protein